MDHLWILLSLIVGLLSAGAGTHAWRCPMLDIGVEYLKLSEYLNIALSYDSKAAVNRSTGAGTQAKHCPYLSFLSPYLSFYIFHSRFEWMLCLLNFWSTFLWLSLSQLSLRPPSVSPFSRNPRDKWDWLHGHSHFQGDLTNWLCYFSSPFSLFYLKGWTDVGATLCSSQVLLTLTSSFIHRMNRWWLDSWNCPRVLAQSQALARKVQLTALLKSSYWGVWL